MLLILYSWTWSISDGPDFLLHQSIKTITSLMDGNPSADFCFNNSIPAVVMDIVNPFTPGTFCKKCGFFGHFGAFQAGSQQISFNPVENAFATQQLAYCVLLHCDLGMRRNQLILRKWPTSLGFSIFGIFFAFLFSPFLFFLLQWLTFY